MENFELRTLPLSSITIGKSQARMRDTGVEEDDDLVMSIRKIGLISPVVVRHTGGGEYELIAGQRRFRAHEILNKPTINALVTEESIDEYDAKKISLIENTARKNMKDADYIDTVKYFYDKYGTIQAVKDELGLSYPTIKKYLRGDRIPVDVRNEIQRERISINTALKALDALGEDAPATDRGKYLETVRELDRLSTPAAKKMTDIVKNNPDMPIPEASQKATRRSKTHKISIDFAEDTWENITDYRNRKNITSEEDAVIELVDMGLTADN